MAWPRSDTPSSLTKAPISIAAQCSPSSKTDSFRIVTVRHGSKFASIVTIPVGYSGPPTSLLRLPKLLCCLELHPATLFRGLGFTKIRMTGFIDMEIQILLVEDFQPCRAAVTSLLANCADMRVICEVSDGLEAVNKASQLKPDLILMDIGLPTVNGLEAARRIRELAPASKIVFLTQETSPDVIGEAIRLGAEGYVFKQRARTDLLRGLAAVLEGKQFISDGLVGKGSE
jgi:CheY-like chemotaxis protein